MGKSNKMRLPKLSKLPFSTKISFELFDENDNTTYKIKKADANRAKKIIEEILGFKL